MKPNKEREETERERERERLDNIFREEMSPESEEMILAAGFWDESGRPESSYPEESIQRAVFHVFSDDHNRIGFGDDALKVNDVEMFELAHYWGFRQEIDAGLVRASQFQRLNGHQHLGTRRHFQIASAHVPEFSTTWATATWNH